MLTTARRRQTCLLCTPVRRSLLRPARASFHASSSLDRQQSKVRRLTVPGSVARPSVRPGLRSSVRVDRAQIPKIKDQARDPAKFKKFVFARLTTQANALKNTPVFEGMGLDVKKKYAAWTTFVQRLEKDFEHYARPREGQNEELGRLWKTLQQALQERGPFGLDKQIETSFLGHLASSKFIDKDLYNSQKAMADLRYPTEWFANTRSRPRKIIMHVGPTNSGKTYHALKRLEEKGGVYAGPLRLLAHEVYTRMNAKGVNANLVTGEERRRSHLDGPLKVTACTVEMVPLATKIGVAVIDEIQMIGHIDRGWAWTQAVLGVQADEVHLCGEVRSVPLIKSLAASMGEEFEVRNYERLTPLDVDEKPIGPDLKGLRAGDCIVAFSKLDIHAIKQKIQQKFGYKVAIVYGSLPPETRAAQARLFNDPDSGYDILVASDAVGMGLNLSIKRIIFHTTYKFNGFETVRLSLPDFKQIAGRAGRFKTAYQANKDAQAVNGTTSQEAVVEEKTGGLVTAIERDDFQFVKANLKAEPEPLKTAGIFPPDAIVERFATFFPPRTPFSFILLQLVELARVHDRFHMCMLKDQLAIADVIQCVDGLSVSERLTFCISPATVIKPSVIGEVPFENKLLIEMARCVGEHRSGALLDIPGFGFEALDMASEDLTTPEQRRMRLGRLESLHKSLVLYLWLSYRFSGVFTTRSLAFKAKEMVEEAIEKHLTEQAESAADRLAERRRALKRSSESIRDQLRETLEESERQDQRGEGGAIPHGSFNENDEVLDIPEEPVVDEVADEDGAVDQEVEVSENSEAVSEHEDSAVVSEHEEDFPEHENRPDDFSLPEEFSGNQQEGHGSVSEEAAEEGQQEREHTPVADAEGHDDQSGKDEARETSSKGA
ncbi:P-loop containing nucleoside triphosphate hydrolase protein [Phyllosticta capitalensis]